MNVGSICSRHIVSLDAAESLQTAAQRMREFHVGAVVVTRSEGAAVHVVGLLTDRDLAIEVLARGGDASQVPVERLAQTPPAGILDSADLLEAVKLMAHQGVRRLVVHDAQGHMLGIVSLDDLLPAVADPLAGMVEVLRRSRDREIAQRGALAPDGRPLLRVPSMGTAGWQQGFTPAG
jgi:signal-transduction protein with cAMP-binding, CBS, and nucleotidyltransferase domain